MSPFLIFISFLIIAIDHQNPLFIQERIGYKRKKFNLFKFRTMKVNESKGRINTVKSNDDRVTNLGDFLRNSFIDELPQILNIIIGDIVLLGPRPLATSQDLEYLEKIKGWSKRSEMKPGITGLSQSLSLRGGESLEKYKLILRIDLWYYKHRSNLLNFKIIIKTIKFILKNITTNI